jgi:hypothetical protein
VLRSGICYAMKSRKFWISLLALVLFVLLIFQYRFPIAKSLGGFLGKKDPIEKCEVIFAPASRIETNFVYAMHLLQDGWGNRLITTTPKLAPVTEEFNEVYEMTDCSWGSILKRVFRKEKLPLEKLTILEDSLSSLTDCTLLYAHWKQRPFQSIIVVTDAPHARRFRIVMDKVFGNEEVKILSCPSFPDRPLEDFFAEGDDYVMFVFTEYIKIVAYAMKYAL